MLKYRISVLLLLLAATAVAVNAQNTEHKPVIGVATLENPPNYYHSTIGSGLTDLLVTELMKTGRYKIIERSDIDDLVDEIEFGRSGYVDRGSSVRKGHFEGLEYLVIGKVTNFGVRERAYGYIVGYHSKTAFVRIDFRVVDATTGEIVYSGAGEGEDKSRGAGFAFVAQAAPIGAVSFSSTSFLRSQIGRATIKAIGQAVDKLNGAGLFSRVSGAQALAQHDLDVRRRADEARARVLGRILAVGGDQEIIISLGSTNGLRPGDNLRVFRPEVVRDSSGAVVFTEEHSTGVITVTDVQSDRSRAAKVSGGDFHEGYIVRRM